MCAPRPHLPVGVELRLLVPRHSAGIGQTKHGDVLECLRLILGARATRDSHLCQWHFTTPLSCHAEEEAEMRERRRKHFHTALLFHCLPFDSLCSCEEDAEREGSIERLLEVSLGMKLMETSGSRAYLLTCSMPRLRG